MQAFILKSVWKCDIKYATLVTNQQVRHTSTHNQAYKNDMTIWINARHNIKERELESMEQTQTHEYVLRFEHTALRPRLDTEGFPLTLSTQDSHTGNLHWGFGAITIWSTQLLSLQTQPLHLEVRHKATQTQSPHTWGMGTKPNNQSTSH